MSDKESKKSAKSTQVQGKLKPPASPAKPTPPPTKQSKPCPWNGSLLPTNVPGPGAAQTLLHPRKDVFVLKVAKIGPNGDRRCKMELELVTPKPPEKKIPYRLDTREIQCDPDPPPCCCMKPRKKFR